VAVDGCDYCEHGFPRFLCRRCAEKNSSCGGENSGAACDAVPADHEQGKVASGGNIETSAAAENVHSTQEEPFENSASDPDEPLVPTEANDAAAPLLPNKADINRHLSTLFAPTFVHDYPDAWIEIAYGNPDIKGGAITAAKDFSAFELKLAAEFAVAKNKAGYNLYVGPALRHGQQPGDGRAGDKNVLAAAYAWVEFDGAGDDQRIDAILKAKNLAPAMIVTTGLVPHRRAHLYFKLEDGANAETVRAGNAALRKLLSSDAVHNASRLMRLAGTINYPPPKKRERGYVSELVTLQLQREPRSYGVDALIDLVATAEATLERAKNAHGAGHSDDELQKLLEHSRLEGAWHNSIRNAVAIMIGRGWSDSAIKLVCAPYCKDGANDRDLLPLIGGARRKFEKLEPGVAEAKQSNPAASRALPLTYYNDLGEVPPKQWIMKGVLARGETSIFFGPPGVGKGILVGDLFFHVASGQDWRGYRCKEKCGAVYFAFERAQLTKRRLAYYRRSQNAGNLPIAVASKLIDLKNKDCIAIIVDTIRAAETELGCSVGVIGIDTLSKGIAAGGGDEDKARDVNAVLANLRVVQELTNVHVLLVGHPGKDESRGHRGSNANVGDADVMVQLTGGETVKTAKIVKANDQPEGVLTHFKIERATLGVDDDGDPITVGVIAGDAAEAEDQAKTSNKLNRTQRLAMELLIDCINDDGRPGSTPPYPRNVKMVPVEDWSKKCERRGLSPSKEKKSRDRTFRRVRSELLAMHRIGYLDGFVWVAYHTD
jgi:hypothetical protein